MLKGGKVSKFKKIGIYALWGVGVIVLISLAAYLMPGGSTSLTTGGSRGGIAVNVSTAVPPSMERAAPAPVGSSAGEASYYSSDQASVETAPTVERLVVKNDALILLVSKAEETAEQIKSIAAGFGGFVDEMDIYEVSDTSKSGTITVRVPADKFDEATQKIKALAIKVERESIGVSDVTEGYADLEARLKNLRAEEAQYQQILKEAKTTDEVLKVTQTLSYVRSNIERLTVQIKYLSEQIAMSSITVAFEEEGDVEVWGIRWRPLFTVKQAFRSMLEGLSAYADVMIGFILVLPVLALWLTTAVAALWVLRKIYRFVKRKFFAK